MIRTQKKVYEYCFWYKNNILRPEDSVNSLKSYELRSPDFFTISEKQKRTNLWRWPFLFSVGLYFSFVLFIFSVGFGLFLFLVVFDFG